ncbi:putative sulfate exporter family transporter [Caldibacillus lycopersici]|uniref:Sulfate exporter family transporter n=1 Tax=Perspicuibacillus lycopersici TaxID=1325689 RepID=A0AAE3LP82_9BACI|nr:putative sulfate exporter family transporter [Perspicuibacillus lycopersici]MCU9614726.1 putative sulfate exporter family transporter [Perspicuibacillus lycopersici]
MEAKKLKIPEQKNATALAPTLRWALGVGFTFVLAFFGFLFAYLPGFDHVGQMASAIVLAIIYRQFFGYPEAIRKGITFSSKKLLRFAIILYGLKLNMDIIFQDGLMLLVRDAGVITFAILLMMWLAKLLRADKQIAILAGIGTGVCGAAAIAAVAPILKTKDEDTAIGVAMIALVGTIFSVAYTILRPILPLSSIEYGIWSGLSLHELAHVALAAAPAGEAALAVGLLAKLGRVFLLIPLSLLLIFLMNRRKHIQKDRAAKIDFPWFLLGFIFMSLFGSYINGNYVHISGHWMSGIATFTSWCLTAAMVGLGLNISLHDLRTKAWRPLLALIITSLCLSFAVLFIV